MTKFIKAGIEIGCEYESSIYITPLNYIAMLFRATEYNLSLTPCEGE